MSYYKDELNSRSAGYSPNISYACLPISSNLNASMFDMDATPSNDPSSTNYNNHVIVLEELWENKQYMRKLKDVFIEQGKHPELFENKYNQYRGFTTENNSRFLHMNILNNDIRKAIDDTLERQLGTDYLKDYENNVAHLQSVPVFVDFNPAYENIETGS